MRELIAVIPMYNEAGSVGPVVRSWAEAFVALGIDWEMRVYDDGSKDGSAEAARAAAAPFGERVRVISGANRGHGPTVLAGYREASAETEWIFQADSDGEMSPEAFPELWGRRDGFDFLVGCRTGRDQGLVRRIVSAVSRMTVRTLFGRRTGVSDVNSPYRLMRASAFAELFRKVPADTFAPNVALSGLAVAKRLRCHETDVAFRTRTTGVCSIRKFRLLKAAVRSFLETVEIGLGSRRGIIALSVIAALSIVAKVAIAFVGYNFDFASYRIVTDILKAGGDVYANTSRYNYAPVWMNTLFFIDVMSKSNLRMGLAIFLGLVDVGIAGVLWWYVSRIASALFLLSPLALYISGFHSQFDNFAILAALAAAAVLMRAERDGANDDRMTFLGAALLGFSLCIKHIFIFFPIWFLFRPIPWRRRAIVFVLPIAIFLMSFVPHVPVRAYPTLCADVRMLVQEWRTTGSALTERTNAELQRQFVENPVMRAPVGILRNVFLYKSYPFAPFLRMFMSPERAKAVPGLPFMILALTVIGFLCRKKDLVASALVYSAAVMAFTPSMADQYLAIPLAFACATLSIEGIAYSLYTSVLLLSLFVTQKHVELEPLYVGSVAILCWLLAFYARKVTSRAEAIASSMS